MTNPATNPIPAPGKHKESATPTSNDYNHLPTKTASQRAGGKSRAEQLADDHTGVTRLWNEDYACGYSSEPIAFHVEVVAAIHAAFELAAQACEKLAPHVTPAECAAAIRALKSQGTTA